MSGNRSSGEDLRGVGIGSMSYCTQGLGWPRLAGLRRDGSQAQRLAYQGNAVRRITKGRRYSPPVLDT